MLELYKISKLCYCERIKINLVQSLKRRLDYLEENHLYALAAILTPKYGKRWLNPTELDKWDKMLIKAMQAFFCDKHLDSDSYSNKKDEMPIQPMKKIKILSYLEQQSTNKVLSKTHEIMFIE
jgi:hypothetical protein